MKILTGRQNFFCEENERQFEVLALLYIEYIEATLYYFEYVSL